MINLAVLIARRFVKKEWTSKVSAPDNPGREDC